MLQQKEKVTRVKDFMNAEKFSDLIERCKISAQGDQINFVLQVNSSFQQWGTDSFLTEKQYNYLNKIAGR